MQRYFIRTLGVPDVNRLQLVRVAIIAATITICLMPVLPAGAGLRPLALIGLLGVLAGVVLLRQPMLGMIAILPLNLLVRASIGTGTGTRLPLGVLLVPLLFGLYLIRLAIRRDRLISIGAPELSLAALVLIAVLSFVVGQLPLYPHFRAATLTAQVGGLGIYLVSAGAFFLAAHLIRDLKWLERLTFIFMALAAAVVIVGSIGPLLRLVSRFIPNGATGSMLWTWFVALAFGQVLFNRKLKTPVRIFLAVLILATFAMHILRGRSWASGWVPALIAVVTILWLTFPRLGLIVSIVVLALAAISWTGTADLLLRGNQYSFETRLEAWSILLEMVNVNPLLGLGPSNYYEYSQHFPILGFSVRFNSHNNYIDLIAQTGYLSLAGFLIFALVIGKIGLRLRAIRSGDFQDGYVHGALGGLAGTIASGMLGDWFLPFVYNIGIGGLRSSLLPWIFLGGLLAIYRMHTPSPARPALTSHSWKLTEFAAGRADGEATDPALP